MKSRIIFCHCCKVRFLIRQNGEGALVYGIYNKPNGNGGKPELGLESVFRGTIPDNECPKCRKKQIQEESNDSKRLGEMTKLAEKKEGKRECAGVAG